MERTTRAQLESMRADLDRMAHELGLLPADHEIRLDIGSKTYGRAYRLYRHIPDGSYAHHSLPISDYMGMTANECWHSLAKIRDAWSWVLAAQRSRKWEGDAS